MPICYAQPSAPRIHWRAIVRTGRIFERISRLFPGISFVIPPPAAVTVAAAGGATPPEVKERGWFPWAASPATVRATPQPLGVFLPNQKRPTSNVQ